MKKIVVLVGSLRKASISKKIAQELIALAPGTLHLEILEIGNLPLYNEDLETQLPDTWIMFRSTIKSCDGLIVVTPEYNRTMPGGLKNAFDVGSRPYAQGVWSGKPAGVISVSPSPLGGFGANQAIRGLGSVLNMPIMPQPEAMLHNALTLFDEEGKVNEEGQEHLRKFLSAYEQWVEKFL